MSGFSIILSIRCTKNSVMVFLHGSLLMEISAVFHLQEHMMFPPLSVDDLRQD